MENASKALLIAGEILISLLVIGLVVLAFNRMNESKAEEQREQELADILEYNKRFEQFDKRVLYGSDIVSIINRAEDYNIMEANEDKQYDPIELHITIEDEITLTSLGYDESDGRNYDIKKGTYTVKAPNSVDKLTNALNSIKNKISNIETTYNARGKPIDTLIDLQIQYQNQINANMNLHRDTKDLIDQYNKAMKVDGLSGGVEAVEKDIKLYTALNSALTSFRAKYFSCTNVEYDLNGRVSEMSFKEATTN